MKSRFLILCLTVALAMVLMLISVNIMAAKATLSARVPIVWFVGYGTGTTPDQVAAQQQVVDNFNASQSTIQLTLIVTDYSHARSYLQNAIVSGNAPDVVGPIGIRGASEFHDYWLDLSPWITATGYDLSDFDLVLLQTFLAEGGGMSGLPICVYPSFIYYLKDAFDQAGLAYPPHQYGQPYTDTVHGGAWTIEKLEEVAKLLTLDNAGRNANHAFFDKDNIIQFGFVFQWLGGWSMATLFGADRFIDANGNAQIPSNWRAAYQWYYAGMWNKFFIPNGPYRNTDWFGNGNEFASGHIAMALAHSWYLGNFSLSNWDIAATPSYNGVTTAQMDLDSFRILKTTKHPAEAFQVVAYLTREAAQALNDTYHGFPARQSLQTAAVNNLKLQYPGVDWQVLVDSITYADIPNHEGYLPNAFKSFQRLEEFGGQLQYTQNLNVNEAMNQLLADLQWLFHEKFTYLPLLWR